MGALLLPTDLFVLQAASDGSSLAQLFFTQELTVPRDAYEARLVTIGHAFEL